jgi:hypothetical protein
MVLLSNAISLCEPAMVVRSEIQIVEAPDSLQDRILSLCLCASVAVFDGG